MPQFIPNVSNEDVERILSRDFPTELHSEIKILFAKVTAQEKPRVIVACIKNSNKNYIKLVNELENANGYWRETIVEAEYPKIKKASKFTEDEINEKRKKQYLQWFNL